MFAWHVHHKALCEPLYEPIENRIKYIKENKPEYEVKTRLRLLKVVKDQEAVGTARAAYDEAVKPALAAYYEAVKSAEAAYDEAKKAALAAYYEARKSAGAAYDKALAEIHSRECPDCPWDGKSIFPR